VSGTLAEWPVLASALRHVGVDVSPDTPAAVLRTLAWAALQALKEEA
jgi:hypothetical protein